MSNIQTGAERMPHDLSHLGFLAGQIGRLITISTTPVIAGDSFEMDAVGALRLSPLRRGLAIIRANTISFTVFPEIVPSIGNSFINTMKNINHTRSSISDDIRNILCSSANMRRAIPLILRLLMN